MKIDFFLLFIFNTCKRFQRFQRILEYNMKDKRQHKKRFHISDAYYSFIKCWSADDVMTFIIRKHGTNCCGIFCLSNFLFLSFKYYEKRVDTQMIHFFLVKSLSSPSYLFHCLHKHLIKRETYFSITRIFNRVFMGIWIYYVIT